MGEQTDYRLRDNRWTTDLGTTVGLQTKGEQMDYRLGDNSRTTD